MSDEQAEQPDEDEILEPAPEDDKQMPGQLAVPVPGGRFRTPVKRFNADVDLVQEESRDKYDWVAARRTYIEGIRREDPAKGTYTFWPTQRDIARLTGVSEQAVRQRAATEHWTAARAAWQAKMEQVRQEMRAKALAQSAVVLDKNAINAATAGLNLIMMRMQEITDQQYKIRDRKHANPDTLFDADSEFEAVIDGRELETLGRAATAWHTLGQKVLGIEKATKVEISGPNGGPLEVRQSVAQEMRRDDPDRLFGFLVAAERSGLIGPEILEGSIEEDANEQPAIEG